MAGCLMFCNCLIGRRGLLITGCVSVLTCIAVLMPALYCLLSDTGWAPVQAWLDSVLESKNWSQSEWLWVRTVLEWLDDNHTYLLAGVVTASTFQLLGGLLLVIAALAAQSSCADHHTNRQTLRLLLLPWLCTDLFNSTAILVGFILWTFISYFIDLYMAIVFPVMGGLLLGVWIVMYRNVYHIYRDRGKAHEQHLSDKSMDSIIGASSVKTT